MNKSKNAWLKDGIAKEEEWKEDGVEGRREADLLYSEVENSLLLKDSIVF